VEGQWERRLPKGKPESEAQSGQGTEGKIQGEREETKWCHRERHGGERDR
jgi:hypothetical protein